MRFKILLLAFLVFVPLCGYAQSASTSVTSSPSPLAATEEKIIGRWKNDPNGMQFNFERGGKVRFAGNNKGWWKVISKQQVQFSLGDEHGMRTGNLNLACTEMSYETQDKKPRRAIYIGK